METNNKQTVLTTKNTLDGIEWVEAPSQPKQVTQLYLKRSTPVIITPSQPVTPLTTNPTEEKSHDVLIVLCQVMQNTMSKFQIHAIYGNIALVEFEPVMQLDPVLPLPLLTMGYWFNRSYRKFAYHVIGYNSMTWGTEWYKSGSGLVKYLCGCMDSDKRFTTQEKLYFRNQISQTLAMPTRKVER